MLDEPLVVHASAVSVPHPDKVQKGARAVNKKTIGYGGEDAYFCTAGPSGVFGLGVADGVYQWREKGIDAGIFSRSLMETACRCVEQGKSDVLKVLQAASRKVLQAQIQGSSTCCIVVVDTLQGRLTSANLGDSGFMVLGRSLDRRGDSNDMHIKFHSPQQEHQFGCPYQLGHHSAADPPEKAMLMTLPVLPGDVIVLGTDGLFDNVSDDTILYEVSAQLAQGKRPSQIAQRLTAIAFNNSMDKSKETPYAAAATEAFDMVYSGGKQDDITVLVAYLE
jgi:protein phosphatase PTC7